MAIRRLFRLHSIAVGLVVGACTTLGPLPRVSDKDANFVAQFQLTANRPLASSVKRAATLRLIYIRKVNRQMLLNRAAGIGMTAAIATAAGFAIRTDNRAVRDLIAILGVTTAGIVTGSRFLINRSHQRVYLAGAQALTCAALQNMNMVRITSDLQALGLVAPIPSPMKKTGPKTADTQAVPVYLSAYEFEKRIAEVRQLDSDFTLTTESVAAKNRAKEVVRQAEELLPSLRLLIAETMASGPKLNFSVSLIQDTVNQAIQRDEPDFVAVTKSFASALPAIAGQTIGLPIGGVKIKPEVAINQPKIDKKKLKELIKKTEELAKMDAAIRTLLIYAKQPPDPKLLEYCNVDIARAGLNFKASPADRLHFDKGKAEIQNVVVSGGQPPYGWTWVRTVPNSDKLKVDLNSGAGGTGVFKITSAPALEGNYYLQIRDAANNTITIQVVVGSPAASGPGVSGGKNGGPALIATVPVRDEDVGELQRCLRDAGIKNVQYNNKTEPLKDDGQWGERTYFAITEFFRTQASEADRKVFNAQNDATYASRKPSKTILRAWIGAVKEKVPGGLNAKCKG